jgi:serine-type D-Ala-D-Ala carboxypeptidase/endopeptidase (penicillin-binding protein 4)
MKKRALLFLLLAFLTACYHQPTTEQNSSPENTSPVAVDLSLGDVHLPKKLEVSTQPKDVALAKKIDELIDQSEFANARWGVIALSLKDGRVMAAHDAQKVFAPASTLKLLTTAAALDKLGADFKWKTSVYAGDKIGADGTLRGSLTLYGRGAPDLSTEQVAQLAEMLQKAGLRRVEGDVVGDSSFFRGDGLGDGWPWGDAQWYYGARASALTFNNDHIDIEVSSETAKAEDDQIKVENDVQPLKDGAIDAIGIDREPGADTVYVWGDKQPGKSQFASIAVPNSASWAAGALKKELEKRGINITGSVRATDWKAKDKLDESAVVELAAIESKTLAEVVRKTNKESVNLYAELMLRTLGKRFGESAPDADARVNVLRGDDQAGTSVIRKWLGENGIETGELALHDGSGLSRLDMISPELLARLLVFGLQMKPAEAFKDSLPVAGVDGTMGGRLKNFSGKVLAKTGSITYVHSLAGYAKTSGEPVAFVIFCNNETSKKEVTVLIDAITAEIASY